MPPLVRRVSVALACVGLAAVAGAALAQPVRYEKKATARETFEASLAALKAGGVTLGPWHYLGPFDRGTANPFEKAVVNGDGVDLAATFTGKQGKTIRWLTGERFRDGAVNDLRIFYDNDQCAIYLFRTITSDGARRMPVALGSDDSICVWLNGRKLLDKQVTRACVLGDEQLVLDLKPGRNDFLMRVENGGGPSGFAFGQVAGAGAERVLIQQLLKDFPPEEVQPLLVEADWLRQDGLNNPGADFKAAAVKALDLARRTLAFVSAHEPAGVVMHFGGLMRAQEEKHSAAGADADWRALYFDTRRLRRRMILAHPQLDFERLLTAKRPPPAYSHMCDQYLGRHSGAGEGLVVLENWREGPRPRPLVPEGVMPAGSVLHPDVSFDGTRVLFSFCAHTPRDRNQRRFHVWEAAVDGSAVRQLTGVPGRDPLTGAYGRQTVVIEDWDPTYLPEGGFAFVSTRNQGFGRCHGGRYTPSYVLYRADADGSNIRRLSFGEANEWAPSVLHDGRLIYCRWDYVNRHDTLFQSLWVTRPDGTGTAHFYGNYSRNPCMISEPQAIPGSHKVVATTCAHHAYTAGSIVVVDVNRGQDGPAPIERVTPEVRFPETEGYPGSAYATPWPISEDLFLAAFSSQPLRSQGGVQGPDAYGIYLVDTLGGRELIYRDLAMSCFSPIPLRPRPAPPVLPSARAPAGGSGTFYVADVYRSTAPLPPGSVRRLRVVEMLEQPAASVPVRSAVANELVKRVVGTVPVNGDGSAAFRAPAGVPLLFQLLDEHDMSVMSMRSQAYLQPGEMMSCAGCHEPRNTAPAVVPPLAEGERGSPGGGPVQIRDLDPLPGQDYPGGLSFARTVQPVFDRYCIRCHGLERVEKDLSLLGTPEGSFSTSYNGLVKHRLIALAHRNSERDLSTPGDYGATAGRLGRHLAREPWKGRLDAESRARVMAWLDLNGQYYGDYAFRRDERRPVPAPDQEALRAQVKTRCDSCHAGMSAQPLAALVNVAAPDESRVLMAPLAVIAGGWGQCREAWPDRDAEAHRGLRAAILKAVGRQAPEP